MPDDRERSAVYSSPFPLPAPETHNPSFDTANAAHGIVVVMFRRLTTDYPNLAALEIVSEFFLRHYAPLTT